MRSSAWTLPPFGQLHTIEALPDSAAWAAVSRPPADVWWYASEAVPVPESEPPAFGVPSAAQGKVMSNVAGASGSAGVNSGFRQIRSFSEFTDELML